MDHRLKNLSYSSILKMHECPRKWQLYRLSAQAETTEDVSASVTFAFGHSVGTGIQLALSDASHDSIVWELFKSWECDLEDRNERQNKSFYKSLVAVQKFISLRANGLYKDYVLASYEGKPAIELSFCINFPDGFRYRGFVDAVLINPNTGEILVIDCKTTSSATLNPASFKNSAQALGYSVVLDVIFGDLSSYKVGYLVYQTKSMEWTPLTFDKNYLQRALWIQELLLDIETIKLYENAGVYPMHGESCYTWYRECEYLNLCTLSTKHLIQPEPEYVPEVFQINVTLADLVAAQLRKE